METFEIPVGQSQRQLRFVPQETANTFNIYAVDKAEDWLNHAMQRSANIPEDGLLGTITVSDEGRFDFNGIGTFTGQELQSMAAQIVRHPDFRRS
jgi:hypothetical protein